MTHCLVICTGNICRSQLAGGYLRALVEKYGVNEVTIETAGCAVNNTIMIPPAVSDVAAHCGFEVLPGKGQQVNRAMLERADFIIVMEYNQASFLLDLEPASLSKIKIIGSYDPEKSLNKEVKDPGKFDVASCLATFQDMQSSLDTFFKKEILRLSNTDRLAPDENKEVDDESDKKHNQSQFFDFHFED